MKLNRHTRRRIKKAIRTQHGLIAKFMWDECVETVHICRRYSTHPDAHAISTPLLVLSAKNILQMWADGGPEKVIQFIDASLALAAP